MPLTRANYTATPTATATATADLLQHLTASTMMRYDYIISTRESSTMRLFFTAVYLSSNLISAICFALLLRFYLSKKYHRVHEKNLNSTCLSLLAINVLKLVNLFWKNSYVNEALVQLNTMTTFLMLTTSVDLYLTLKSIIKDVFVEEAANRKRFALYSLCGWMLPAAILRLISSCEYLRRDFVSILITLHCCLNFITVLLIRAGLRTSCYTNFGENFEGYKYYSDEKSTSNVVRILSTIRLVFHALFLISRKHAALSVLDFFRAYEGMFIYYYLVVERRKKWSYAVNPQHQSIWSSSTV